MTSVTLRKGVAEVADLVNQSVRDGEELLALPSSTDDEAATLRARFLGWDSRTSLLLDACFATSGFMSSGPKEEFGATGLNLLDLKLSGTPLSVGRVPEVLANVREKVRVLRNTINQIDLYKTGDSSGHSKRQPGSDIFLIHGHDLARREVVRRFLETVTHKTVIILEDQPNRGLDVLGKLLDGAVTAGFAVVLLTADDDGRRRGVRDWKGRARQNVVFEFGLFIGLLGRGRVSALYEWQVELPSDLSGIAYIEAAGEQWQLQLARELKAAGFEVKLDDAI